MDTAKRLREIREGLGLSIDRFAKAIGMAGGSSWQRFETPERYQGDKPLPVKYAKAIWRLVANSNKPHIASEAELLTLAGIEQQPTATRNVNPSISGELASRVSHDVQMLSSVKDLPILGRARGGGDAFYIEADGPMVKTYRPHLLDGVPDAYAVETWDTSMEPVLRHGWMLWVHPRKPFKPGDVVVIQLTDGQALVKELVRRTETQVTVRQYNPAKDYKIERASIKDIHLVVGNTRGMT